MPGWLALWLAAGGGVVAGAVATIAGFGIGSLLTPLVAQWTGTKLAVAAVSIPHAAGTALRLLMLKKHVDRRLLSSFGAMSAAGGLAGALLHAIAESRALAAVFGALLLFAGLGGLTGATDRLRFRGRMAWVAGAVSGILGGLVGNQGGIRSAAMLGFDVPRHAFVATATAVAMIVDGARVPVYLAAEGRALMTIWPLIAAATIGVMAGTLIGARVLHRVPEMLFRRAVSVVLLVLGTIMLLGIARARA